MKVQFDPVADALYVSFSDNDIVETEEVRPGVMFDYDVDGRIVAMEILSVSQNIAAPELKRLALEVA